MERHDFLSTIEMGADRACCQAIGNANIAVLACKAGRPQLVSAISQGDGEALSVTRVQTCREIPVRVTRLDGQLFRVEERVALPGTTIPDDEPGREQSLGSRCVRLEDHDVVIRAIVRLVDEVEDDIHAHTPASNRTSMRHFRPCLNLRAGGVHMRVNIPICPS